MSRKLTPEEMSHLGERTRLVHAGRDPWDQYGFLNTPVYRGSTVLFPSVAELTHPTQPFTYGTRGTPTIRALETAWSELSGAHGSVVVTSGLAAVTLALLSCLKAGDHLLVTDSAYPNTRNFSQGLLKRFGVEATFYDPLVGAGIEALMRPNTRAVLVESPGSNTFEVQDVPAIAAVAHRHDALVIMDNTWATPLFFSPHAMGADIAVEAGTKYVSGHSDMLLGLVSANEQAFPALRETFDSMAPGAGPDDCYLALRGLRTMPLRLREHEKQALDLAAWLRERPEVKQVLHPGLPGAPGHELWKRDFKGSTGLFSIILNPVPKAAVAAMLDGLRLFGMGWSWGGYSSLVVPYNGRTARTSSMWQPGGPVLRIYTGLEDLDDLKADLDAGFERLRAAS
jgi:cystathionine beta-lyase